MNKFIIYGSLWNFDVSQSIDSFEVGDFLIKRFKRPDVKHLFQQLPTSNLHQNDVNILFTILSIYEARPFRDFPHFIVQTSLQFKNDFVFEEADRKIKHFLTSLRLYQNGNVLGRFLSALPEKDFRKEMMPIDSDSFPNLKDQYVLTSHIDFEKFFKSQKDIEKLIDTITVDRFNLSFQHYNAVAERLIDLIISLEGLFNKSPFDVKYKVALRSSHLLHPGRSSERQKTYMTIVRAYNLRNKIVHGLGKVNSDELESINSELDNLVRKILLIALDWRAKNKLDLFGKNIKEEDIDRIIINS